MVNIQDTLSFLSTVFKNHGFRKKGLKFFKKGKNYVQVVQIQKSRFDTAFYINMGVKYFLDENENNSVPSSFDLHLMYRYKKDIEIDDLKEDLLREEYSVNHLNALKVDIERSALRTLEKLIDFNYLVLFYPKDFSSDEILTQNISYEDLLEIFHGISHSLSEG